MSSMQTPKGTTHLFINTKNKKSFYSNKEDGSWEIFNKGLGTWEKVPSLDLNLIPISVYLQNEIANVFTDVEDTVIDITNVTVKNPYIDFICPPITPEDYLKIYKLFEKHSNGEPLGFTNGIPNHTVIYDHKMKKWYEATSWITEHLSVYTSNLETVKKVLDELNASVHTTI